MAISGVVITGFGGISPLGVNTQQMWEGLSTGRCGIGQIRAFDPSGFPCRIAGEVPEYKIRKYVPRTYRKATKLMCRDIELSVIAADEAIRNAGLVTKATDPENVNINPERTAINIGAGLISCDLVELAPSVALSITDGSFDIHKWGKQGLESMTPLWLLKYLPNMLACHISIIHDIQGPSNSITCGEASSHLTISEAAQVIARGNSDIALAGGAEAKVNPVIIIRQCLLKRATDRNNDTPEKACRPFDEQAGGSVFGEGAGIVVLESLENAKRRGGTIYAELAGAGQSNNINSPYQQQEPDGTGIRIAIENALADARISPEELDLIIPHGTGIPGDDTAEAQAIEAALGKAIEKVSVWPTKSMISNTGAAAGALDVIAGLCTIKNQLIPPSRNFTKKQKGCNLDIITQPKKQSPRYILCCSYTYGGQTAAVVLKRYEGK